jgi:hypothetical protein
MNDQQKHLAELFAKLMDTPNHDDRERMIENEACKHKESIRELAQENAELKRKLYDYENNYKMGRFTTLGDLHNADKLDSVRFVTITEEMEE